jgi:hypothetical protein
MQPRWPTCWERAPEPYTSGTKMGSFAATCVTMKVPTFMSDRVGTRRLSIRSVATGEAKRRYRISAISAPNSGTGAEFAHW